MATGNPDTRCPTPVENRDIERNVSRTENTVLEVQVELAERDCHNEDIRDTTCPEGRPSPAVDTSESTRLEVKDSDIELQPVVFTSPGVFRTTSTEHLVPPPSPSSHDGDADRNSDSTHTAVESSPKVPKGSCRHNYKPISLRWPFVVFLLFMVAGLFAFLEYQIHDLPPLHYSLIQFDPMERRRAVNAIPSFDKDGSEHASQAIVAFNSQTNISTSPTDILGRDARPPSSGYPGPAPTRETNCGWKSPKWVVAGIAMTDCVGIPCSALPALCSPDASKVTCAWQRLTEHIDTFTTNDTSWCPCRIKVKGDDWSTDNLDNLDSNPQLRWDTADKGCLSVMLAIESFNHFKTRLALSATILTATRLPLMGPPARHGTPPPLLPTLTYTTPPLPATGYWAYPSTDASGAVFMPVVSRTAGPEISDVFGNPVKQSDTAPFPEAFHSRFIPGSGNRPMEERFNPCFVGEQPNAEQLYPSDPSPGTRCTEVPATYPIKWIRLPFSRPTTSTTMSLTTGFPTLSAGSGSSRTSSPPCTNCDTDITTDEGPGTTSTLASTESQTPDITKTDSSSGIPIALVPTSTTDTMSSQTSISTIGGQGAAVKSTSLSTANSTLVGAAIPMTSADATTTTGRLSHEQLPPFIEASTPIQGPNTQQPDFPPPIPTADPTPPPGSGPISPDAHENFFNLRSETDYLMASVIPVLLATLLSIPIQIFTNSIGYMLPFRALGHHNGAEAKDSLCLSRNPSFLESCSISFRFIRRFNDPLPLLCLLLNLFLLILVPLSSETIRLELTTDCGSNLLPNLPLRVCAVGLRKSGPVIRVAEGLLVAISILIIGIGVILFRWRSALLADPWSVASITSLLPPQGELRALLLAISTTRDTDTNLKKALQGRRFKLESLTEENSNTQSSGIKPVPMSQNDPVPIRPTAKDPPHRKPRPPTTRARFWHLTDIGELHLRLIVLFFTVGLLVLILDYETVISPDTAFEAFMNSQSFGVRILFTAFGTIVSVFWSYYFSCKLFYPYPASNPLPSS